MSNGKIIENITTTMSSKDAPALVDLKVLDVRTQVFVENLLNRSVRLDILATDSTGAKLNVEVQIQRTVFIAGKN